MSRTHTRRAAAVLAVLGAVASSAGLISHALQSVRPDASWLDTPGLQALPEPASERARLAGSRTPAALPPVNGDAPGLAPLLRPNDPPHLSFDDGDIAWLSAQPRVWQSGLPITRDLLPKWPITPPPWDFAAWVTMRPDGDSFERLAAAPGIAMPITSPDSSGLGESIASSALLAQAAAIPEPGAVWLWALGTAALLAWHRFRSGPRPGRSTSATGAGRRE